LLVPLDRHNGVAGDGKHACPFCYYTIDTREPWFRCTGRPPAPGKRSCKPVPDTARQRLLGTAELRLPSFPGARRSLRPPTSAVHEPCGNESHIRVCPHCHIPLLTTFGVGNSPLIGWVGAQRAGKSVYLQVLSYELTNVLRRRFGADVRLVGDMQYRPEFGFDYLDSAGEPFPDRRLYAQTTNAVRGRRAPVVFAWRQYRRQALLSFPDDAGEDLEQTDETLRYLAALDALIVLLDPFMIPGARKQIALPLAAVDARESASEVVGRMLRDLQRSRRSAAISIPIAVVITKFDAFFDVFGADHPLTYRPQPVPYYDEQAGRSTHEQVRALLHDWEADDIDAKLNYALKNVRYFVASALGEEPDYETGLISPRGPQPFRVDEPLLWLLSHYRVIPRSRARQ
jgi:hypothetical protein